MTHDLSLGIVRFANGTDEIAYKMPHKIEQFNLLMDLEKVHTKLVYFGNEEDKRRGVEYMMNKILGFYKECLELRPEYLTRLEEGELSDKGGVIEALRKSDQVYQNLMENTLALNHKLDELIESLKSLPKKINEEDLAERECREQQDLSFENENFKSQAPPSFDVYTPPVIYSEEVEETIGISMEVEHFDQTQLEDIGLNTCSHDLFLSSREIPSVDELEPQLLPKFSPLDVNLGDKRGTDPPINPYSPGSFRIKALRKSDQVYQNLMENSLALNHKLDELIESLKSLPKKINKEDLAEYEYREQQDLEVEETIGISMEVEHFDQTQLEDIGLNTCSHDLFLSSREIPSVDELEPQLLPKFSPLDVNLGDKRGTDPPINPYSLGSFRMKVIFDKEKPESS
ncbi:hypothetical protein Tco_1106639 [Tanacetum coccineum]